MMFQTDDYCSASGTFASCCYLGLRFISGSLSKDIVRVIWLTTIMASIPTGYFGNAGIKVECWTFEPIFGPGVNSDWISI